jgi:hypothetical protein
MKINLEKACIGFLIGILLYCVCNKKFLIEGLTGPVNTCHDNKCDGNDACKDTCTSDYLCFNERAKVCINVEKEKCGTNEDGGTGPGFTWCGSGDTPFNCADTISRTCVGNQKDNPEGLTECAICSETALGRDVDKCIDVIDNFCVCGRALSGENICEAPAPGPHSSEINIVDQPELSVQIVNNTTEPWLHIFLQYSNADEIQGVLNSCRKEQEERGLSPPVNLPIPPTKWTIIPDKSVGDSGLYNLSEPNNPNTMQFSDLGKGSRWQKLSLKQGAYVTLNIPDFVDQCPFRIIPLKALTNDLNPDGSGNRREWCNYGALYDPNPPIQQRNDCGKSIIIEMGKDAGANMSAVDGVNFKLKAEFSDAMTQHNSKFITTYFNNNPCNDEKNCITRNGKTCGCINPAKLITMGSTFNKDNVPGSSPGQHCRDAKACSGPGKMFTLGKGPGENIMDEMGHPCYHGTCNLQDKFKTWADDIHDGQCANSDTTYPNEDISGSCGEGKGYTTYSYDYDDANSLAYFKSPYKMKLTYYDLN